MTFQGESIKLIDQYVGQKFIIVLAVTTFGHMATGMCYSQRSMFNAMLLEVAPSLYELT
jgi:hypothetical protein